MVFNTLYNVVDIYFAGRLDTASQAGLAIGFTAYFIFIAFGVGLSAGMSALIGSAVGQKDADTARHTAAQGVGFAVFLSAALMLTGWFFGHYLIDIISETGPYRFAGTRYFDILVLAIPGFLIAFTCNGILLAQGDGISMQRALMAAFFANICLNPLMIYGLPGLLPGMGFDGIAASTVVSQSGVMVFMIYRLRRSDVGCDIALQEVFPTLKTARIIGLQMLPTSFSMQVMIASGFMVQFALKGFGGSAIAGYGVGLRIEQLFLLPVLGIANSLLPIAAQNYGAQDFARVREAFSYCLKIGVVIMVLLCPILWVIANPALGLFTQDPEVIRVGVSYLHVDVFLLPVYTMLFIINSFLQALKRPIWVLWIGIFRQGFGVAFFVWLFIVPLGFGVSGVWYGIGTSVILGWLLAFLVAHRVALSEIGGLWNGK
ncbi:MAG: MATE family efflux transporter [Rhodobacteraceae bacterium]|nr:MATE family efflux transporter [Paracoccaceae bacterium]